MRFEWDEFKAEANVQKHRVSFFEAIEVLRNPYQYTVYDDRHSESEDRFITIGLTTAGRLVVVVHAEKQDAARIISARVATRRERKDYEDGNLGL